MKTLNLVLIALFALPAPAGAEVYRWVDESGTVHFSDSPGPDAERIEIPEPTTVQSRKPEPRADRSEPEEDEEGDHYERFAIEAPGHEEQVRSNNGRLDVRFGIGPGLREGDRIELLLDGDPAPGSPFTTPRVTHEHLNRGEHALSARIVDGDGKVQADAGPVTFYLFRASAN